jgi:hypothetical protein
MRGDDVRCLLPPPLTELAKSWLLGPAAEQKTDFV